MLAKTNDAVNLVAKARSTWRARARRRLTATRSRGLRATAAIAARWVRAHSPLSCWSQTL